MCLAAVGVVGCGLWLAWAGCCLGAAVAGVVVGLVACGLWLAWAGGCLGAAVAGAVVGLVAWGCSGLLVCLLAVWAGCALEPGARCTGSVPTV